MSEGGGEPSGGFFQQLITKLGYSVDTEGLERLNSSLETVAERAKLLLGIEVVKGLYELSERFAGLGESLESSAVAAGLTTEELQKLQFAASQNAVDAGSLNSALFRLGRLLNQAQKGSRGAGEAFKKLGIDQEQIKSFSTTEDALLAIQDNIGNLSSQQEKLAVVQQLFGRSGSRFLKFLQAGSAETNRLKESASQMGAVISDQGVKSLAAFEDAASGLGQVLKSFFASVASVFAPSFIGAIHAIEDAWGRNRKIVEDGLMALGHRFAYVMGFASAVIENFSKVVGAILYRKGGIGEYVQNLASSILEAAKKVAAFIGDLVEGAISDGSLKEVFTSFIALLKDVAGVAGAVANAFGMVLVKALEFFGIKTDGIGKTSSALRGLLATLNAIVTVLDKLVQVSKFLFEGKIGDMLGQTFLGTAYGQGLRVDDLKEKNSDYNALLDPNFHMGMAAKPMAQFAPASAQLAQMAMSAPTQGFSGAQDPQSRSYQINSNVVVNVPTGMNPDQAADLFKQKSRDSLLDALNQAHRDSDSAWQY